MKQGKVWGCTTPLLQNTFCEVHEIQVKEGAKCSKHRHLHRSNAFYVISGELKIFAQKIDYELTDETTIGPREICIIPPGEFHWFEALADTRALEIYFPSPCDPGDIEREDCGSAPEPESD